MSHFYELQYAFSSYDITLSKLDPSISREDEYPVESHSSIRNRALIGLRCERFSMESPTYTGSPTHYRAEIAVQNVKIRFVFTGLFAIRAISVFLVRFNVEFPRQPMNLPHDRMCSILILS
jgi:hypothetical protein